MKTIKDLDVVADVIKYSKAVFETSEFGGYIHSPFTLAEMFDDGWEDIDDGIYAGRFADEASLLDWLEAQCRQIGCGLDRRRLYRELERNDVLDGSIAEDGFTAPLEEPVPATPTGDRAAIAASAQAIRAHSALRRTGKGQGR